MTKKRNYILTSLAVRIPTTASFGENDSVFQQVVGPASDLKNWHGLTAPDCSIRGAAFDLLHGHANDTESMRKKDAERFAYYAMAKELGISDPTDYGAMVVSIGVLRIDAMERYKQNIGLLSEAFNLVKRQFTWDRTGGIPLTVQGFFDTEEPYLLDLLPEYERKVERVTTAALARP